MAYSILDVLFMSWISKNWTRDWNFFGPDLVWYANFDDKEFGHVCRAAVYFEPLGGIFSVIWLQGLSFNLKC